MSAAPSSRPARVLPPPPAPRGAGRCWLPERRCAGRELRVSASLPGSVATPARGEWDRERARRCERQSPDPPAGRAQGAIGAMSYQGKKSIPHITVSRPPRRPFVVCGWSPPGSGSAWESGGGPEGFCDGAAVGAGRVSPCSPLPPSLGGQWVGEPPHSGGGAGLEARHGSPGLQRPPPQRMCQRLAWLG